MDNLKEKIASKLKEIEKMIDKEENNSRIEKEIRELDGLLEEYLKDMWK